MKNFNRLLICVGCLVLLAAAWLLVATQKTDAQIQAELIEEAKALMADKIYVRAEPLLEEAAGYDEERRDEAESLLKEVYAALSETTGYAQKLIKLTEKQVSRKDSPVSVYYEAADYYVGRGKYTKAIEALRLGKEHTADADLTAKYEQLRYSYTYSGYSYDNLTSVYNGMLQVQYQEKWGLASATGELVIPCEYDKISTYSNESAIVRKDGEIFTVNSDNLRTYVLKEAAQDFGNFGNNLLALKTDAGWVRASGTMTVGSTIFEEMGMYTSGYAAVKKNGKWGVIDTEAEWFIEPEYDEVVMNELGACCEQNAIFVRDGSVYFLVSEGKVLSQSYQDARPFNETGWAAVKMDGKWMFIDAAGQIMLECGYDNVQSFSGHLAAAEVDGKWGYISMDGTLVIPAEFVEVKNFSDGVAPVRTEDGWQFIVLDEYKEK